MPISKRLYPHAVSSNLSLTPRRAPFDPEHEDFDFSFLVREDESDEDIQTLDLTNSSLPWTTLQFDMIASIPDRELARVLHPPVEVDADTQLIVAITCSDTRLRTAVQLDYSEGVWEGTVKLSRRDARGAIRLTPRLVRKTDILESENSGQFALSRGLIIAEGRSLNIRLDPPPPGLDGILTIRWENFKKAEGNEWLQQHYNDLFFLDLADSNPVLLLNSHHAQFKAALHSKSHGGPTAIVRHLGNALIAQAVWLQLFHSVASSVGADSEAGDDIDSITGWKKNVLRMLLPRAFPGVDPEEQLRKLRELSGDGSEAVLFARLSAAAQDAAKSARLVGKATSAVTSIQETAQ